MGGCDPAHMFFGGHMPDKFSRTAMLFGRENMEKLYASRVAVFGVGGVGGHCAEALARSGIGSIDIFDSDRVDVTNINRQLAATTKTLGLFKADVMRERILEINPDATVTARKIFYLPENADDVDLSVYSCIADAVDTVTAKIELACRAAALGVPIISCMGAANRLDASAFRVTDIYQTSVCPVARVMRNELRKRGVGALRVVCSAEPPVKPPPGAGQDSARPLPASNAFTPPVAGLIMAGEIVKMIIGEPHVHADQNL